MTSQTSCDKGPLPKLMSWTSAHYILCIRPHLIILSSGFSDFLTKLFKDKKQCSVLCSADNIQQCCQYSCSAINNNVTWTRSHVTFLINMSQNASLVTAHLSMWVGYFSSSKLFEYLIHPPTWNFPLLCMPSIFRTFVKDPEIIRRCDVCINSPRVAAAVEMLLLREQIGARV